MENLRDTLKHERQPLDDVKTESFVRLLLSNDRDLQGYAYSLLLHAEDAREAVQDAAIVMWQHFHEYDASRAFFPWASRFVYFSVLKFRTRRQRAQRILNEAAIAAMADDYRSRPSVLDGHFDKLPECLEKLPAAARKLIEQRYRNGQSVQDIARQTGRSVHTLYKAYERLREWLLECINHGIAAEDQG